jgi:arsenate reductase (thioredoxin)
MMWNGNTAQEGHTSRLRVLFLCTGNSARSQMAEGLLRFLGKDDFDVFSAGSNPYGLNPLAVQAMAEIGIDTSQQRSKHLNEYLGQEFNYVITVCDQANETCPTFPGDPNPIYWSYPDPATAVGDDADKVRAFRKVRDELRERLHLWILNQRKLLRERSGGSVQA